MTSLEKCYVCILLLEIVAQWDYYYRIESTRKCIRSYSPTPTVSKAHNFFSRGDNLVNVVTPWNVGFKIRLIGSHFIMFQILLLMLTFPWLDPLARRGYQLSHKAVTATESGCVESESEEE